MFTPQITWQAPNTSGQIWSDDWQFCITAPFMDKVTAIDYRLSHRESLAGCAPPLRDVDHAKLWCEAVAQHHVIEVDGFRLLAPIGYEGGGGGCGPLAFRPPFDPLLTGPTQDVVADDPDPDAVIAPLPSVDPMLAEPCFQRA